jgi:hypothetical protein
LIKNGFCSLDGVVISSDILSPLIQAVFAVTLSEIRKERGLGKSQEEDYIRSLKKSAKCGWYEEFLFLSKSFSDRVNKRIEEKEMKKLIEILETK